MYDCLPLEVLVIIFTYLPRQDLARRVQFVCRRWQYASWDKSLWTSFIYNACGDAKETIDSLALFPRLRNLNLLFGSVNNDLIRYLSDSCPNLEVLQILWDSIYNCGEFTLIRPLLQIKKLILRSKCQSYMDCEYLHRIFPNLEQLEIFRLLLIRTDIVQYLKTKRSSLQSLSIPCWTANGQCVLPCLSECENLKTLSLRQLCKDIEDLPLKEVEHLSNISSLSIIDSNVNRGKGDLSVFNYFPNIFELKLFGCSQSSTYTLRIIGKQCPRLRRLDLTYSSKGPGEDFVGSDSTLEWAHCLECLTHLSIYGNVFLTDRSIQYLQLIPKLTHLDLYECKRLTIDSLQVICGFDNLQLLKFDLNKQNTLRNLIADNIKNRDIQILFYNCKDLSGLDTLRRQQLRVSLIKEVN